MTKGLSRNTSIYLDILRLIAALMVFMTHSRNFIIPKVPGFLFGYGGEAVAVFFVLSGFVISFVVSEKEHNWKTYTAARLSRIYPVIVVAIITTTLADSIGNYFNHSQYLWLNDKFHFYRDMNFPAFLSYITFTNQIWFSHFVYGSDEPYWSLGFEVWYYVIIGIVVFAPVRIRIFSVVAVVMFCGPKIIAYFPLWLFGYFGHKFLISKYNKTHLGLKTFIASIILSIIFIIVSRRCMTLTNMYENFQIWQTLRNVFYFYTIGLFTIFNIIVFDSLTRNRHVCDTAWEKRIRWAAGASFTLYLVHQPIEVMISALFPNITSNLPLGLLALLLTVLVIVGLAELGERRKRLVNIMITSLFRSRIEPSAV